MFRLRAILTIPELARLANVHRHTMERLLRQGGVPTYSVGRIKRVFISDIKDFIPALWASICCYQETRP